MKRGVAIGSVGISGKKCSKADGTLGTLVEDLHTMSRVLGPNPNATAVEYEFHVHLTHFCSDFHRVVPVGEGVPVT